MLRRTEVLELPRPTEDDGLNCWDGTIEAVVPLALLLAC